MLTLRGQRWYGVTTQPRAWGKWIINCLGGDFSPGHCFFQYSIFGYLVYFVLLDSLYRYQYHVIHVLPIIIYGYHFLAARRRRAAAICAPRKQWGQLPYRNCLPSWRNGSDDSSIPHVSSRGQIPLLLLLPLRSICNP